MVRALITLALCLPVGACASAKANAPIEAVSLEVPPVPPRTIDRAPVEPPPIPLVEELPISPPSPLPARPRPPVRDTNRAEPKTEARPEAPEPEPPTHAPPATVAPLRTGTAANGPDDRQIREMLDRANRLLETVDLRGLSEDRRAAFDSAKDSITRAQDALKASNVVLARSLAERAENFAKLLISRQH